MCTLVGLRKDDHPRMDGPHGIHLHPDDAAAPDPHRYHSGTASGRLTESARAIRIQSSIPSKCTGPRIIREPFSFAAGTHDSIRSYGFRYRAQLWGDALALSCPKVEGKGRQRETPF